EREAAIGILECPIVNNVAGEERRRVDGLNLPGRSIRHVTDNCGQAAREGNATIIRESGGANRDHAVTGDLACVVQREAIVVERAASKRNGACISREGGARVTELYREM